MHFIKQLPTEQVSDPTLHFIGPQPLCEFPAPTLEALVLRQPSRKSHNFRFQLFAMSADPSPKGLTGRGILTFEPLTQHVVITSRIADAAQSLQSSLQPVACSRIRGILAEPQSGLSATTGNA